MNRVIIILVNWNGWRDTIECLESLLLLDYTDFRIVICDNGSTDDSLYRIRIWADHNAVSFIEYSRIDAESGGNRDTDPKLTLIRNEENLGFAGGNNVGLRYGLARTDVGFFWLLNNDTAVDAQALTHLINRMQENPTIGMCGSTIRLYHDRERIQALGGGHYCQWLGLPLHYGRFSWRNKEINHERAESRMNYIEGASMLVSQRFIDAVGLMCEDYFLYFEEADWAIRASGRFTLGYAPQSVVYHKVGSSIGTSSNPANKSLLCDFYNIRNRILFAKRHYPVTLPTIYLVLLGEILLRVLCGKFKRAVMIMNLMIHGGNCKEIGR